MDKKLTDKEIVKALETCCGDNGCFGCPYTENHSCRLLRNPIKDALDLINRLQAQVEKCEKVEHFADKTIATLQAENEEQEKAIINVLNRIKEVRQTAKAEAYKEFAELLKKHSYFDHKDQRKVVSEVIIDHYLKRIGGSFERKGR